jgi:hypothetical protein
VRKGTAPLGGMFEGALCTVTMFNVTNCSEQILPGATNSSSDGKENARPSENTKIHYRVHKS